MANSSITTTVPKTGQAVQTTLNAAATLSTTVTPQVINDGVANLEVSITPVNASSKILIMVTVCGLATTGNSVFFRLLKDGSNLFVGDTSGSKTSCTFSQLPTTSASLPFSYAFNYLDTAGNTSSRTYSVYVGTTTSTTFYINRGSTDSDAASTRRGTCNIIALEILP